VSRALIAVEKHERDHGLNHDGHDGTMATMRGTSQDHRVHRSIVVIVM
jgi:hypothetical protein